MGKLPELQWAMVGRWVNRPVLHLMQQEALITTQMSHGMRCTPTGGDTSTTTGTRSPPLMERWLPGTITTVGTPVSAAGASMAARAVGAASAMVTPAKRERGETGADRRA